MWDGEDRPDPSLPKVLPRSPSSSWVFPLALCSSWPLLSGPLASLAHLVWGEPSHPPSKGLLTDGGGGLFSALGTAQNSGLHLLPFWGSTTFQSAEPRGTVRLPLYMPWRRPAPSDPLHKKGILQGPLCPFQSPLCVLTYCKGRWGSGVSRENNFWAKSEGSISFTVQRCVCSPPPHVTPFLKCPELAALGFKSRGLYRPLVQFRSEIN